MRKCSRCERPTYHPGQRYCAVHHNEAQRAYHSRVREKLAKYRAEHPTEYRAQRARRAAEKKSAKVEARFAQLAKKYGLAQ